MGTGSSLTSDEIDRMVNEAKQHTEQDKKNRELIEEKNKLEGLVYAVRKTLNENKSKISEKELAKINESLSNAESRLTSKDITELKSAYTDLTKISHSFTDLLYKESKKSGNTSSPEEENNSSKSKSDLEEEEDL